MDGNSYIGDREEKIADIIREYSKGDENCDWLMDENKDMDNVFKKSFHAIKKYTGDFDLALWYLSFAQTFGGKTETMHRKVASMCTKANKDIITLKKDLPEKCPYYGSKDDTINSILAENFSSMDKKDIKGQINNIYKSEKFSRDGDKWCNLKIYEACKYRVDCPVHEWIELINNHRLRFRGEPQIFFYYDTLCLLNNSAIRNFDELFTKIKIKKLDDSEREDTKLDDTNRTIVIRSLLDQIRGISTKSKLFLQMEKLYNKKNLDYSELIFVDKLALRVAKRIEFPFYQNDLVDAIRKFGESYKLTARQMDMALWEMGFVCSANECLHGVDGKKCIFYDVCPYEGKK